MASYALDVTNQRVKKAMEAEGVVSSDLLLKSLADFATPRISAEIQQIRSDYYSKKLSETVKLIKRRIRRQIEGPTPKIVFTPSTKKIHTERAPAAPKPAISLPIPTHKSFSSPALTEVARRMEIAEGLKNEIRREQEEARAKKREHEKIVKELEHTQAQLQKDLIRNLAQSGAREKRVVEARQLERVKSQTMRSAGFHPPTDRSEPVETQLSRIEARIEANRQQHAEALRSKSQKAARTTARAFQFASQLGSLRESQEEQRLIDYIAKQKKLEMRQKSVTSASPQSHQPRTAPLTARTTHDCFLSSSQQAIDFDLRMEEQRLKDEEKRLKVTRERRKFVIVPQNRKRLHWLGKLLNARDRADQRNRDLTLKLAKHHDTSIQMMIVKTQGEELRQQVLHSPNSKALIDKLRSLAILPPPIVAPQ